MITRTLEKKLRELAGYYPAVVVTGPRQSGKTTLCRMAYPDKPYVSLEALDIRDFADSDPRGFLAEYSGGAIIDEIQHVPELLSYLQSEIDVRPDPGRFILTGSQHFGLSQSIAQSLAGRCGILALLPPSLEELSRFSIRTSRLVPFALARGLSQNLRSWDTRPANGCRITPRLTYSETCDRLLMSATSRHSPVS